MQCLELLIYLFNVLIAFWLTLLYTFNGIDVKNGVSSGSNFRTGDLKISNYFLSVLSV